LQIRIFFGAHRTRQDHLRQQLEHNRDLLADHGTLVPASGVAEAAMWQAIKALRKGTADDHTAQNLFDQLSEGKACERVLVIRPSISGSPLRPSKDGKYYPRGGSTIAQLVGLIGEDRIKLYFASRNPASFLPSCYQAALLSDRKLTFEDFGSQSNPFDLRWSEYLHRVQGDDASMPLTVWSNEDYPYIWRTIAQAFSGVSNKEDLQDSQFPVDHGMSLKGAILMHTYLQQHMTSAPDQLSKINAKFEQKFPPADGEAIAGVWPAELVMALTDAYDDDNYYIDRMENIRTIRRPVYR
jgi:hypothetical protein